MARPRADPELLRKIAVAVFELVAARGVDGASMRAVAGATGLSTRNAELPLHEQARPRALRAPLRVRHAARLARARRPRRQRARAPPAEVRPRARRRPRVVALLLRRHRPRGARSRARGVAGVSAARARAFFATCSASAQGAATAPPRSAPREAEHLSASPTASRFASSSTRGRRWSRPADRSWRRKLAPFARVARLCDSKGMRTPRTRRGARAPAPGRVRRPRARARGGQRSPS